MKRLTTVIVDPNPIFREGLRQTLLRTRFRPVRAFSYCGEVPGPLLSGARSLFFIVSQEEDGSMLDSIKNVLDQNKTAILVVLSSRRNLDDVRKALQAGARAVLAKGIQTNTFVKSLELLALGETLVPACIITQTPGLQTFAHEPSTKAAPEDDREGKVDSGALQLFSGRESAILRELMHGTSNKGIARKLAIAEATVKVHIKAILRKIRVQNRTQAAIWAHGHNC